MKTHPQTSADRDSRSASLRAGWPTGNVRRVLEAAVPAARAGRGVLALVLETEGSTYANAGAMALFDGQTQTGWLSGGCLEPEIARRADAVADTGAIGWLEIDTRDDEDLFSGSALGCRGRLRIALLPLHALAGIAETLQTWLRGGAVLARCVQTDGQVAFVADGVRSTALLMSEPVQWHAPANRWSLPLPPPPELLLLGAGPEAPALLRMLRELDWRTTLVERRDRWRTQAQEVDVHIDATPVLALQDSHAYDAALVMHHNFELDRAALESLAISRIPFVGLLGPRRRRDDLFRLLAAAQRDALQPRLRSPVGLDLGGKSPHAIALSIAAQLQAWRHGARDG